MQYHKSALPPGPCGLGHSGVLSTGGLTKDFGASYSSGLSSVSWPGLCSLVSPPCVPGVASYLVSR